MAKQRKKKKSKASLKWSFSAFICVCITLITLVTANEKLDIGLAVPTWNEIISAFVPDDTEKPKSNEEMGTEVHFIDVGNADCSLIISNGQTILVDAGNNENGVEVVNYLNKLGITRVDYLIGTHPHADHIGGLDDVVKGFEIGTIIMPKLPKSQIPTTKTYLSLLTAISDKGLTVKTAKPNEEFALENAKFTVLAPNKEYEDINDYSVVIKFEYGDFSVLIGGDASKDSEEDILKQQLDIGVDVYKVQHHGSKSSNTADYLAAVDADYYFIPVGEGNSYGHPHPEVMDRLTKTGKPIYRADLNGTVVFETDGKAISVSKEKES